MSRLAEDIATLQRAADAAGLVIYPGGSNASFPNAENATVPVETLAAMGAELEALRTTPREYRLIADEAVWLLRTAQLLVLYRADGDSSKIERFQKLGEYLRAAVEVDLASARKSLGVIA